MSARTIVFPSEPFEELRTGALQGVPTCKAVIAIVESPDMNKTHVPQPNPVPMYVPWLFISFYSYCLIKATTPPSASTACSQL